jgi:hypothetical protein
MVRVWADRALGRTSNAAVMIARTWSGSMMVGVGRRLPRPKTPQAGLRGLDPRHERKG